MMGIEGWFVLVVVGRVMEAEWMTMGGKKPLLVVVPKCSFDGG